MIGWYAMMTEVGVDRDSFRTAVVRLSRQIIMSFEYAIQIRAPAHTRLLKGFDSPAALERAILGICVNSCITSSSITCRLT